MPAEASTEPSPSTNAVRRALRKIDPHLWDAVLASFFAAAGFIYVLTVPNLSPPFRHFDAIGVILLLAVTLPLAALRTYPFPVFIIIGSASMIGAALNEPIINVGYVTGAIALFSLASRSSILRAMVAALCASLTLIVVFAFLLYRDMASIWLAVGSWFLFSAVWLAGVVRHALGENRREAREALERAHVDRERAELYLHDLEMHAQEAVALERSRLARELHDVVGHALNVVVLQAGAAQRLLDKKPEVVRESLSSIEAAGRQALADIERMLGILRAEAADREELGPQPGLTDIGGLIDQVREAGLPVSFANTCASVALPSSLDMSGYRIVQEALTNTLKHAGAGARASVRLGCNGDWFEIECLDDGRGLPPDTQFNERLTGGRGLLGMRERVLLFGGELELGPRLEGGFRVFARLPLEGTGSLQRGVGMAGGTGGLR